MPRKAPPLNSFAPELKQAWVKAATETVAIRLPTREAATSLRHRLYKLRVALAEAQDPLYESAQFATIRIGANDDGTYMVILEPADSLYKEALREAGVSLEPPPLLDFGLGDSE
jgi:hypothetical protein